MLPRDAGPAHAERLGVEPGDLIVFIEHKTSEIILRASKIGSAKKKRVQ